MTFIAHVSDGRLMVFRSSYKATDTRRKVPQRKHKGLAIKLPSTEH